MECQPLPITGHPTWTQDLESVAQQDAQRNEQGPQPGVRDETCTPQMDFHGHLRHPQTDRGLFRHKGSVPSPGYQEPPQAGTAQPFPRQGGLSS